MIIYNQKETREHHKGKRGQKHDKDNKERNNHRVVRIYSKK